MLANHLSVKGELDIGSFLDFSEAPITLVGGAGFYKKDLMICLKLAPTLIAADGGAEGLKKFNRIPDYILGDLDSILDVQYWEKLGTKIIEIQEQDTTDFEKCLYSIRADTIFGLGFVGKRVDHFLAVCSSIIKYHHKRIILIGSHDIIFHIPRRFKVKLKPRTRISLFPMKKIVGIRSSGLKWPISGLTFDPICRVGTSNMSTEEPLDISLSDNGMLMIIPKNCFGEVISSFNI